MISNSNLRNSILRQQTNINLLKNYTIILGIIFFLLSSVIITSEGNNPNPLGLELGVTTLEEFQKKYPRSKEDGIDSHYRGPIFLCSPTSLALEDVRDGIFFFNHNNILVQITLIFPHEKYSTLNQSFSKKYTLLDEKKGHQAWIFDYTFGKQRALYKKGNIYISLETDSETQHDVSPCMLVYSMIDSGKFIKKNSDLSGL